MSESTSKLKSTSQDALGEVKRHLIVLSALGVPGDYAEALPIDRKVLGIRTRLENAQAALEGLLEILP
jgi:hypothetical protein